VSNLGRRTPTDFAHIEKHPFSAVVVETVTVAERVLLLPSWHWTHDQGAEGSCVGHGSALERAITNSAQNKAAGMKQYGRRYNPLHLWNEAKKIDEWPDTNPGDENGTSVRAAYDVLRTIGPERCQMRMTGGKPDPYNVKAPLLADGVAKNRWAETVDEMRTAITLGLPVVIGVDWYGAFDEPTKKGIEWWLPEAAAKLGKLRGGHCVCLYGASDKRQAFKLKNSWGRAYPLVWLPYSTMQKLLGDYGEACLTTDR
jgi:hypothetical protein